MGSTVVDLDRVQWGSKGWHVEHVGQSNKLFGNVANNRAASKTRSRDVVGQDCEATRSGSVLHK